MRLSYSDLLSEFLDDTYNTGSTDTTLTTYFQRNCGARYQLISSQFDSWQNQKQATASTVASQQFYYNPVGIVNIVTATVEVGGIYYPLVVVDSQYNWDVINEILITTSAIPQFLFPRQNDYGIWPIPQGVYTIAFNYNYRDRILTQPDYTTGTIALTNGAQTITGSGTTFIANMAGRWLNVATPNGDGFWYRILSFTSTAVMTLETNYAGQTGTGLTYRVCETPEVPEEAHILLAHGAVSDWFAGPRGDSEKSKFYNNMYWTGDGQNSDRTGTNVRGGLIGLEQRYASRSDSGIIRHRPKGQMRNSKLWAQTLS